MATAHLAPCPFCGADETELALSTIMPRQVAVGCARCGAYGPQKTRRTDAIAAWNLRLEPMP